MDYEIIKPIAGGGLGDCKIGIYQLSGTYEAGGIDIGLKDEPMMLLTNAIYTVAYDQENNKVIFQDSDAEISGGDMDGVKIVVITKGSI